MKQTAHLLLRYNSITLSKTIAQFSSQAYKDVLSATIRVSVSTAITPISRERGCVPFAQASGVLPYRGITIACFSHFLTFYRSLSLCFPNGAKLCLWCFLFPICKSQTGKLDSWCSRKKVVPILLRTIMPICLPMVIILLFFISSFLEQKDLHHPKGFFSLSGVCIDARCAVSGVQ